MEMVTQNRSHFAIAFKKVDEWKSSFTQPLEYDYDYVNGRLK